MQLLNNLYTTEPLNKLYMPEARSNRDFPTPTRGLDSIARSLLYIVQELQGYQLQTAEQDDLSDNHDHPLQPLVICESCVREEEVLEERIVCTLA
eukprot:CAMPEP_0115292764 /NCGR_PEP_ID=MMETSP0270-20121206/65308_1 /TAXON_ID=71861 /ORGANISM="Scrippsiella trochoidea, Strain CCMP3099" /LENGTH=94 /DNA_ID=CAMNT_0002710215 /DNA_START=84 /DNA_END=368 /DNA_ORIENTATION=-